MDLHQKKCIPCESGDMPLTEEEAKKILVKTPNWILKEGKIEQEFVFKNFVEAMKFVNMVGDLAERIYSKPDKINPSEKELVLPLQQKSL